MARQIEIQGHRGVLASRHGNTLASFAEALGLGVSAIELDVWLTGDNQLALRHDASGADGDLRRLPLRDIEVHKVAATMTNVDVEHRVPTLPETLALFRFAGAQQVVIDIEVKVEETPWDEYHQHVVSAVTELLQAHQHEQAFRIRSFDPRIVRAFATMLPNVPGIALTTDATPLAPGVYSSTPGVYLEGAADSGAAAIAPEYKMLSAELVDLAHEHGLKVYPWDVKTANEILLCAELGVDGLCLNDVILCREVLSSAGYEVPEPHPIRLPMFECGNTT